MQISEVGDYLAKRLAAIAMLVDKSMPAVAALFYTILHGKGGRWRGSGKTLLFDVASRLAQRLLQNKLIELDGDVYPYLASLIMSALVLVGETLAMPEGTWIMTMIKKAFNNILLKEAGHNYDNYGLVNR